MTKLRVVVFLIFLNAFGRNLCQTSSSPNQKPPQFNFSSPKAPVEQLLSQLAKKHNIKFLYSNKVVARLQSGPLDKEETTLAEILNDILSPHNLTYAVVNNSIAIYQKTQPVQSDSAKVKSSSDTLASNILRKYIYNVNPIEVPRDLRIKLDRLHQEELKKARQPDKDSTAFDDYFSVRQWLISFQLGVATTLVKQSNQLGEVKNKDVKHSSDFDSFLKPCITLGYLRKHLLFKAGIALQRVHIKEEWAIVNERGNSGKEPIVQNFAYEYHIYGLEIPFSVSYCHSFDKLIVDGGVAVTPTLIFETAQDKTELIQNYRDKIDESGFNEEYTSLLLSVTPHVALGYRWNENIFAEFVISYQQSFSQLIVNDAFSTKMNSLIFGVRLNYAFEMKK